MTHRARKVRGMQYDKALSAFVEFAASRHNAVHSSEAAEISISHLRLRRTEIDGTVYRLQPRVWAVSSLPRSNEQALRGAALSIAQAAATTTSAAWLHGWLADPPSLPQLWVPATRGRNHPAAELNRWSRIEPDDIAVVSHIPTLNRAATLCSLGPHVSTRTLEKCLDDFLRSESLRWLEQTMDRLGSRKPGGVAALRSILDHPKRVNGVTDSWFERVVAGLVTLPWMPPIELQHEVNTSTGRFRLDIACPDLKLGVEAHSRSFHWRSDQVDADNVRDIALTAEGWQLIYITWSQASDAKTFVRQFAAAARSRATLMGLDLPAA